MTNHATCLADGPPVFQKSGSSVATMSRKKVIVFIGAFSTAPGGLVGGVLFACRSLAGSGIRRHVEWLKIDSMMRSLPPPGLHVRAYDALRRVVRAAGHLASRKVDGLLAFSSFRPSSFAEKGVLCILGWVFRKRVVLSLRSEIRPPKRLRLLSLLFVRTVVRCCNTVICQSPIAAEQLQSLARCNAAKTVVIPNWIDAALYLRSQDHGKNETGEPHTPVVLFMGWLHRNKGVYELLDAIGQCVQNGRPCRLVYCGGGAERDGLENRCEELGIQQHVEFRGWVGAEEKIRAFHEADVFALPSYSEGLPNALMEAMAAGLPVVTTPVGGIPMLVKSERNGILVSPGDPAAIAEALGRLFDDPSTAWKMGQENCRFIVQEHGIDRLWPRIAETLGVDPCDLPAERDAGGAKTETRSERSADE